MKSLTDQFISDFYGSLLHIEDASLSTTLTYVYDGLGNKTGIALSGENVIADNLFVKSQSNYITIVDYLYPVNSILLSVDDVNPQLRFIGTTWEKISQGRFLAGIGTGNDGTSSRTISAGNGSGKYNHTLTVSELPNHNHGLDVIRKRGADIDGDYLVYQVNNQVSYSNTFTTAPAGSNQPHNNTPPEFGVYVWKRTQ